MHMKYYYHLIISTNESLSLVMIEPVTLTKDPQAFAVLESFVLNLSFQLDFVVLGLGINKVVLPLLSYFWSLTNLQITIKHHRERAC